MEKLSKNIIEHIDTPKSLEELKEIFSKRLEEIIYEPLTVENIKNFGNDTLEKVVGLIDDIEMDVSKIGSENLSEMDGKDQEDYFLDKVGLSSAQKVIELIIEKEEQIKELSNDIEANIQDINLIITPPEKDSNEIIGLGEDRLEKKDDIPRLLTLMYILETDYEINTNDPGEVKKIRGVVTNEMMRKTPYIRTQINVLNRVVYTCDEEGNSSYIFDLQKLKENNLSITDLDLLSKPEKNKLIENYSGIGKRITHSANWRNNMSEFLKEIPVAEKMDVNDVDDNIKPKLYRSEFIKKLPFDEFKKEAKAVFNLENQRREEKKEKEISDISKWYREEYKKHPSWPSNPRQVYGNKGWQGYPELVDREKLISPIESFSEFQKEVKIIFNEEIKKRKNDEEGEIGSVSVWYEKEYKKYPGWPSNPRQVYGNKGWQGHLELVGREKPISLIEFFSEFQKEVKAIFNKENEKRKNDEEGGIGDISKWYREEYKKHFGWPCSPERVYENKGWQGYLELVDREKPISPIESFSEFQKEVKIIFNEENEKRKNDGEKEISDISKWYREEYKKYSGWPCSPEQVYEDKGWQGYLELVDKK